MSAELQQLLRDAQAAYRRGRLPEAKALLLESLERDPHVAYTYYLLSNISLRQDDPATAEQHGRRAVELDGADPTSYRVLVRALRRSGGAPAALDEFRRKAGNEPGNFAAAYGLSLLLLATGRDEEIRESLDLTRKLAPNSKEARLRVVRLYVSAKLYREALRLLQQMRRGGDSAELHGMAGKCLLGLDQPEKAAMAFEQALRRSKDDVEYHVGLSVARFKSGQPDDARRATTECLERFPSFARVAKNPEARVLVISALGLGYFKTLRSGPKNYVAGNLPALMPARRFTMHDIYINHPDPVAAARSIGEIDLVFNNVANAEVAEKNGFTAKVSETVDALGVPVINAPDAVARTSRQGNAETIPSEVGIFFPKTVRYGVSRNDLAETRAAIRSEFPFPFLIRSVYSQADDNVAFISDETALNESLKHYRGMNAEEIYAIEYRTEPVRPGIFRRLRGVLVDGAFYASHILFANNWNVHNSTANHDFRKSTRELPEGEASYVQNPETYLGAENIGKLEALARMTGLEYLGVDFNLLKSGELVLFEANPAMSGVPVHHTKEFAYLGAARERITLAIEEMILRRAGKA